jgi:hypothetical protein
MKSGAVPRIGNGLFQLLTSLLDLAQLVLHPAETIKKAAIERFDADGVFDQR